MTISLKRLSEKLTLKWPVTLVTAYSEVTECNESWIGVKRSQNDIRSQINARFKFLALSKRLREISSEDEQCTSNDAFRMRRI